MTMVMNRNAAFKYIIALLLFGSNGIVASHIALTSYEIVFTRTSGTHAVGRIIRVLGAKSGTPDEFVHWGACCATTISALPCLRRK